MASGPDVQYVNVECLGPEYESGESFSVASYDVTRTYPLVENPSEYYMSVIRASIDNATAPLFIVPLIEGSSTITPWEIGIVTSVGTYTRPLIWQTQVYTDTSTDPIPEWGRFCWSVENFVSMINVALSGAFDDFRIAEPTAPQTAGDPEAYTAPSVFYSSDSGRFSFVMNLSWPTPAPATWPLTAGQARVIWNDALLSRFDGFRILNVPAALPNSLVFEITANNKFSTSGLPLYYQEQSFDCNSILSSVSSYVLTTASLPVVREAVAPTTGTGDQIPNDTRPASQAILCDFVPQISRISDLRASGVYYTPSGEYRLIDLVSSRPLNRVDVQFQWRDRRGKLYPVVLANNGRAEAKLMFIKKSLVGKTRDYITSGR